MRDLVPTAARRAPDEDLRVVSIVAAWLEDLGLAMDYSPSREKIALFADLLEGEVRSGRLALAVLDTPLIGEVVGRNLRRFPSWAVLIDRIRSALALRRRASLETIEDGSLQGLTTEEAAVVRQWRATTSPKGKSVLEQLIRSRYPAAERRMIEAGDFEKPDFAITRDHARVREVVQAMSTEIQERALSAYVGRPLRPDVTMSNDQVVAAGGFRSRKPILAGEPAEDRGA